MPASMMSADVGGTLNVIGSSIAIVASGPMPGSTPISVPEEAADEAVQQVLQRERDAEAENQVIEIVPWLTSPIRKERIRQAETVDEQSDRADRQHHGADQHFHELELVTCGSRHEDEHDERRNEAAMLHQNAEEHSGERQDDERADRPVAFHRIGFHDAEHELVNPEEDHDAAQHDREIARTHAQRASDRVVLSHADRDSADSRET